MKKILILLSLTISLCFCEDNFISMCKNPTIAQEIFLKAMINERNSSYPLKKYQINYTDKNICKRLSQFKHAPDSRRGNITDISILKYFPETTTLDFYRNQITDITPIKYLTKLEKLELMGNTITKGLDSLKDLPLKYLAIDLGKNVDISPIRNIKTLERIFLFGGKNYEVLNNLTNLKTSARINSIKINSLCKLNNLKSLKRLYLSSNNLKSLKCIENFESLEYLEIKNNQITDLTPLIKLDSLMELVIRNNPIEDISPLAKMKKLNSFQFSDTKIKYLSPLGKSKTIKYSEDASERFIEEYFNRSLSWCSPKNMKEVRAGITCFEKDGTLKVFWKRWLGI